MIAINVCDDGTARTIKAQYYKNSAANLANRGGGMDAPASWSHTR